MPDAHKLSQISGDIRNIYSVDKENAEAGIEAYLADTLSEHDDLSKITLIEKLIRKFEARSLGLADGAVLNQRIMEGLFAFLLGKHVPRTELTPDELMERLAESLKTVFDMLNQLVSSINKAFLGEHGEDETIRQIIGYHMGDTARAESLESYLEKINKAFLVAQQAFELAAETNMKTVMEELNPRAISELAKGGLKLGPLQKAEAYRVYTRKYEEIQNWVESGRYMEQLLREFERNCQDLFSVDIEEK